MKKYKPVRRTHRESIFCGRIMRALKDMGRDPVRVESSISPGLPDINIASGAWIEIKTESAISPAQRLWAERRTKAGGNVYVICKISTGVQLYRWVLYENEVHFARLMFGYGIKGILEAII
jgi:hypothetical protein